MLFNDFVSNVRNTFSKAEVRISKRKIIVRYEYRPAKFFCQEVDGELKDFLLFLFDISKEVECERDSKSCEIIFSTKEDIIDDRIIVFPPIQRELSADEVIQGIRERAAEEGVTEKDIENNEQFVLDFIGKWESVEEIREKLKNLFQYVSGISEDDIAIVNHKDVLGDLVNAGDKISEYFDRYEITTIGNNDNGIALIKDDGERMCINGDFKTTMMYIINMSDVVSIESDEKYMDFRLYFSLE